MKQVSFLLTDAVLKPSCLFGAIEVFQKANDFYLSKGRAPYYDIQLVGTTVSQNFCNTSLVIPSIKKVSDVQRTDLIVIPATEPGDAANIRRNSEALAWLHRQYLEGAELASLCTGTFILAATGLLKGKECSTHWRAGDDFRRMFPDVKLCTDRVITDNKGIYTAGGAVSALNLVLYLVEKYSGREVALYCSKLLQIDIQRDSQSPFIIFAGQKEHHDEEIKAVQDFIERNIEEKITVDLLADKCAMNRVNFSRRFKKATDFSPIEYIQRVKIEAAKRGLEASRRNVNEVMYSVGYVDVKAFRSIFKKVAGVTPQEYKMKFGNR